MEGLVGLSKEDFVVVEGKNDVRSLKRMGLIARVVVCSRAGKLRDLESRARAGGQHHRIVLLPDFDREGREKMRRWRSQLSGHRGVDSATWRILKSLLKSEGIGIEGLARLAEKLGLLERGMWLGPDEIVGRARFL